MTAIPAALDAALDLIRAEDLARELAQVGRIMPADGQRVNDARARYDQARVPQQRTGGGR